PLDSFAANGFELTVITAVVIGGVNVFGGSGTILGVVLGAVLVATISDGFTLLRLSEFWKIFFNGLAIVVAVTIDALVTRRLQEALRRRRAGLLVAPGAGAAAGAARGETRAACSCAGRPCPWLQSSASASGAGRCRRSSSRGQTRPHQSRLPPPS